MSSVVFLVRMVVTDLDYLAIGLLVMMYPILCKVQYETLHRVFRQRSLWVQIGFSVLLNWIVAPLLMVGLLRSRYTHTC